MRCVHRYQASVVNHVDRDHRGFAIASREFDLDGYLRYADAAVKLHLDKLVIGRLIAENDGRLVAMAFADADRYEGGIFFIDCLRRYIVIVTVCNNVFQMDRAGVVQDIKIRIGIPVFQEIDFGIVAVANSWVAVNDRGESVAWFVDRKLAAPALVRIRDRYGNAVGLAAYRYGDRRFAFCYACYLSRTRIDCCDA